MAHSGLDVPPASRQDIISALLNDYGNSFGVEGSPRGYSPIPTPKDLPPTPSEYSYAQTSSKDKPLPPVVRMSMRFQLRVDDPPSPTSPNGSRTSTDSQPRKIVSRRLTRGSKPPSLKLTVSNGSTAIVPPTPSLPQPSPVPASNPREEGKALPPPPPPEKSERRQQRQEPTEDASAVERPPRKDSLGSTGPVKRKPLPKFTSLAQLGNGPRGGKGGPLPPAPRPPKKDLEEENERVNNGRSASAVETSTSRKRSDMSGEEMKNPRSFSAVEKQSDHGRLEEPPKESDRKASEDTSSERETLRKNGASNRQLPPTPPDEIAAPAPPPKKPFGAMGLPSNPRAKPKQHARGKSSTGFDLIKSPKAAPEPQAPIVETLTPGPTPSPQNTEGSQQTRSASPTSPVQNVSERRPFSFEAITPPKSAQPKVEAAPAPPPKSEGAPLPPRKDVESNEQPPSLSGNAQAPVATPEPQNASQPFPPRTTSRNSPTTTTLPAAKPTPENQPPPAPQTQTSSRIPPAYASLPSQQRLQQRSPAPQANAPSRIPPAFASLPSQQRLHNDEDDIPTPPPAKPASPEEPQAPTTSTNPAPPADAPSSPPPFSPLTRHPVNQPAPPLTSKHLACYSRHATHIWSRNTFQPMACMVCHANDKERKWACVWCNLRICVACSSELVKIPGRDVKVLVEARGADAVREGVRGGGDGGGMRAALRTRDDMKRHDSGAGSETPTVVVWRAEEEDFS